MCPKNQITAGKPKCAMLRQLFVLQVLNSLGLSRVTGAARMFPRSVAVQNVNCKLFPWKLFLLRFCVFIYKEMKSLYFLSQGKKFWWDDSCGKKQFEIIALSDEFSLSLNTESCGEGGVEIWAIRFCVALGLQGSLGLVCATVV